MKELVTVLLGVSLTCVLSAGDWPKWLGPSGNSMVEDTNMVTSIPDRGLITKWEHEVGLGYGGPSVADGRVYLMDYIKVSGELSNNPGTLDELTGTERVLCFDSSTGKLLWKFEYNRPYKMSYPAGPRCTPIVDGGLVYAFGAEGDLNCLDAITGKVVWSKNFNRDYGAETPVWGHSAHPLVHGDTLYCVVGGDGSVAVAFDKKTGRKNGGLCRPPAKEIVHRR